MDKKLFSIIIPTYNSASTLKATLDSIKSQSIDKNLLQVLLLDGGSTDKTIEIAKKYDFVSICDNPDRLPEYAKMRGAQQAVGKFLIKMDSDEVFCSKHSLENRLCAFEQFPEAHLLVADRMVTPNEKSSRYISSVYSTAVGDPFTFFMYRPKTSTHQTFSKNIIKRTNNVVLFKFSEKDKRPIADGGTTTINLDFIKSKKIIDFHSLADISSMSDKVMDRSPFCLCIIKDDIFHNNQITFKRYIEKLKFRVINNVFGSADSGFSNRKISGNGKKFLFPIYSVSILFPLFDAIRLSFRLKSCSFLLHPVYCVITTFFIGKYLVLKLTGKEIKNKQY